MKNLTLFISFILSAFCTFSQNITGTVVDSETKQPLMYANISVKGKSIGAITDSIGHFEILRKNLSKSDTLVFSYLGYLVKPLSAKDFLDGKTTVCELSPFAETLQNVDVYPFSYCQIAHKYDSIIRISRNLPPFNTTSVFRQLVVENDTIRSIYEVTLLTYNNYSEIVFQCKIIGEKSYSCNNSGGRFPPNIIYVAKHLDLNIGKHLLKEKNCDKYNYEIAERFGKDTIGVVVTPMKKLQENRFDYAQIVFDTVRGIPLSYSSRSKQNIVSSKAKYRFFDCYETDHSQYAYVGNRLLMRFSSVLEDQHYKVGKRVVHRQTYCTYENVSFNFDNVVRLEESECYNHMDASSAKYFDGNDCDRWAGLSLDELRNSFWIKPRIIGKE
ncbi:MAG: carboxypeptidase-like regulatory domain-containing protein [Bacteroidales bacterium]|nr:carboxypeptidase-like regulatory domain-containing protein [Bacteroidales bacterium]